LWPPSCLKAVPSLMKLAYFINGYPKISHTFIRREIEALEQQGAEVMRVALRPNAEAMIDPADQAEEARTQYILGRGWTGAILIAAKAALRNPLAALQLLFTALGLGFKSQRGAVAHVAYALEALVLATRCRERSIRHIHAHFGTNSATVAMFAARFAGLTYSFTAHGADEIDQANSPDMQMKLKHASFVVGVSWFVRSQLIRRMNYADWGKIKVIHCGLGEDFLDAPTPPYPATTKLVCLGRLCEEKAQHLLVAGLARARALGADAELVLAGDGPMRGIVESVIADNNLQSRVTITGWIAGARVKHELSEAKFMVLPSLLEGLPVAIMEAMAMGRPVISTYVSGIPELVVPGQTGWLVPAGDVEALAQAILAASKADVATIAAMGRAGKQRVSERHSAVTEAQKLHALFKPLA
jgi:colanic acid/amylovoran biosynthesis glycosyltransferase